MTCMTLKMRLTGSTKVASSEEDKVVGKWQLDTSIWIRFHVISPFYER